jgi:hypothetical protein
MSVGAPPAAAQLTDDEVKCELGTSLAIGSKFITEKAKCIIKCEQGARNGANPVADCSSPFAGATATCVSLATSKATGLAGSKCAADCPECYGGSCTTNDQCSAGFSCDTTNGFCPGDCASDAAGRVAAAESALDVVAAAVYCDDSGSGDGLTKEEGKCQDTTAKALSNFASKKALCYRKCRADEHKGKIAAGSCNPPASDPKTSDCISMLESKTALLIDKKCEPLGGDRPECFGTTDGAGWAALVEGGVDGASGEDQGDLYCQS